MKRLYKSEKVYCNYILTVNGFSMQFMIYKSLINVINQLQDIFFQVFTVTNDRNQKVRYY